MFKQLFDNLSYRFVNLSISEKKAQFLRYLTVGGLKTVSTLLLLWFLIDKMSIPINNTYIRFAVIGFVFLAAHFLYKAVGYRK